MSFNNLKIHPFFSLWRMHLRHLWDVGPTDGSYCSHPQRAVERAKWDSKLEPLISATSSGWLAFTHRHVHGDLPPNYTKNYISTPGICTALPTHSPYYKFGTTYFAPLQV